MAQFQVPDQYNLQYTGFEVVEGSAPDIKGLQLKGLQLQSDDPQYKCVWWMTNDHLERIHDQIAFILNLNPRQ